MVTDPKQLAGILRDMAAFLTRQADTIELDIAPVAAPPAIPQPNIVIPGVPPAGGNIPRGVPNCNCYFGYPDGVSLAAHNANCPALADSAVAPEPPAPTEPATEAPTEPAPPAEPAVTAATFDAPETPAPTTE